MCYQLLGKERSNILPWPSRLGEGRNDVLPACEVLNALVWDGRLGSSSRTGLLKAVESGMDGTLMAVRGRGLGGVGVGGWKAAQGQAEFGELLA